MKLLAATLTLLLAANVIPLALADVEEIEDEFGEPQIYDDFDSGHVLLTSAEVDGVYGFDPGTGGTAVVQSSVSQAGGQALKFTEGGHNAGNAYGYNALDYNANGGSCSQGSWADGATIDFWYRIPALPVNTVYVGVYSGGARSLVDSLVVSINGAGVAGIASFGGEGTDTSGIAFSPALTIAVDTWYHFRFSDISKSQASFTAAELTTSSVASTDSNNDWDELQCKFSSSIENAADVGFVAYIDGLAVPGVESGTLGNFVWCSAPGNEDFGYDFHEGVFNGFVGGEDSEDNDAGQDLYYGFSAESDDYDYLGKSFDTDPTGFTTSTESAMVLFDLKAEEDGDTSVMAVAFSTVAPTGTNAVPILNKGTGDSAGETSGDFANHVEVLFTEVGDQWNVKFYYVAAGGALTQFGTTLIGGNPNNDLAYAFQVDTTNMLVYLYTYTAENVGEEDEDITLTLANPSLPFTIPAASNLVGDDIFSQWFVARDGGTTVLNVDLTGTLIGKPDHFSLSSCIYSQGADADANGDLGSQPGTNLGDEEPTEETTELSEHGAALGRSLGIGEAGGQVLLALVFMLIFGGFVYNEFHHNIVGFGIGAALGLVLSIFTGVMPPVVTFLLVLAGAVFVGMRWFGGSGAASDGGM